FNDQQIREFLRPWQAGMSEGKTADELVRALCDRPHIMELARNPLMLTIIAYLYTDIKEFRLPHSRAEFYKQATDVLLLHWHQSQNQYHAPEKRAILQALAIANQEGTIGNTADRRTMPFRDVLAAVEGIVEKLNREKKDVSPLLREIVERSGLLLEIDGGQAY